MKPKLAAVLFLSVMVLAGCIVQSIRPFATEANRVPIPEGIAGQWELVSEAETERTGYAPWTFAADKIELVDERGNTASLETVFFRLGDRLYLDSLPDSPDEKKSNRFWNWHVAPMHLLCRVERTDDTLTLYPLNYEWLNATVDAESGLPYTCPEDNKDKDDWRIYTASPAEWEAFLLKHANDPDAFPTRLAIVLRRLPEPLPLPPVAPAPAAPAAVQAPPPPPPPAPVAP
jgi:hypothetical protein